MSPLLPPTFRRAPTRSSRSNCHTRLPSRPVALLFALDPRSPPQPKPSLRRTHRSLPELASHPTANGRPRSIIRSSRAVIRIADSTGVEHPRPPFGERCPAHRKAPPFEGAPSRKARRFGFRLCVFHRVCPRCACARVSPTLSPQVPDDTSPAIRFELVARQALRRHRHIARDPA